MVTEAFSVFKYKAMTRLVDANIDWIEYEKTANNKMNNQFHYNPLHASTIRERDENDGGEKEREDESDSGEEEEEYQLEVDPDKASVFHAKGLWISPPSSTTSTTTSTTTSYPTISLIGSSNYGERSWNRDVEMGAIILTNNDEVRCALDQELREILMFSNTIPKPPIFPSYSFQWRWFMPWVAWFCSPYL